MSRLLALIRDVDLMQYAVVSDSICPPKWVVVLMCIRADGLSSARGQIIVQIVRAVYSFKGLRRAPGMSGKLKRYVQIHPSLRPIVPTIASVCSDTRITTLGRATGCILHTARFFLRGLLR